MAFRIDPIMSPAIVKDLPLELRIRTRSEPQTMAIGRELGRLLKEGCFVGVRGELGSGKTRLIKGIAEGLGVPPSEQVASPTFAIIHEYLGGRLPLYHVDLYRIPEDESLDPALGLEEYVGGPGVCVVEWPERMGPLLPGERMDVEITIEGPRTRGVSLRALGPCYESILDVLKERLKQKW